MFIVVILQTGLGVPLIDHYDYSKKPEEDPEYIKRMEEEKRLKEEKKERQTQVFVSQRYKFKTSFKTEIRLTKT